MLYRISSLGATVVEDMEMVKVQSDNCLHGWMVKKNSVAEFLVVIMSRVVTSVQLVLDFVLTLKGHVIFTLTYVGLYLILTF